MSRPTPFPVAAALAVSFLVGAPALAQTPPVAPAPPPKPTALVELSTLRKLRDRGVLSQAEYESAVRDLGDSTGARKGDDTTVVVGKFAATLYGFAEADAIWDSTQSLNDSAGNALIQPPSAYGGKNTRAQFSVRNSRFGIRAKSPETRWFRASGVLEMDFLGATLPIGSGQPYFGTEAAYFNNPTLRIRHAYLKVETPIVDVLFGQYWHLFGWGPGYFSNTVEIQGLPGELYSRTAQLRVSKTVKSKVVALEVAVAAMRPPQRDSGAPEGTAGVQLAFLPWHGMQTVSATGTQLAPASIAITGDVRKVAVPEWSATPKVANAKTGGGVAVDAFIPVVPATPDRRGNSLTLTGEFVYGSGLADLYTGLTGGVPIAPALPNPMMKTPPPTYAPDIDPGIAAYDATGKNLSLVQWTTLNVGAQYYFPRLDGRLWVSVNYARTMSSNAKDLLGTGVGATASDVAKARSKIRDHEEWYDANLFGDPYPGVRLGLEYARFNDTYVDGARAANHRVQFSGFYIF